MMTRSKITTRDLELKLKTSLQELQRVQELNNKLIQERDECEVEIKNIIDRNSLLKSDLAELDIQCEDLRDQRDQLQERIDSYDECQEYITALSRIQSLELQLSAAQEQIEEFRQEQQLRDSNITHSLYNELLECDKSLVSDVKCNSDSVQGSQSLYNISVDNADQNKGMVKQYLDGGRPNVFTTLDITAEEFINVILWKGGLSSTEIALTSPDVQKFLKKDNKFDLVISEQFFQEATYVLAHKYNAPLVLVTTFGNCMRHNILVRNPLQLATVLPEFVTVLEPSSFYGRLRVLYGTVYEYFWWRFWYMEKQMELAKKYIPNIPEPVPSLIDLQKNVSLILLNSHFSFDTPMAIAPNIVEIGGVHLTETHLELSQDLKKIMDDSKDGVIYMNFGSNVRSSELPLDKKNAFLNVFRKLKQTVLWKWEDDKLENQPKNVVVRKWLPQKEILAHPNIKVFVAHGGLIGMQEAIFHGVPVVGVPIYADQYNNLLQAQEFGFGKILQYHEINEANLETVLSEVLNNESYKEKAQEVSRRFLDRPLSALDTAMFWIEYVIRNKGAEYMKNPAMKLSWVAYAMLDVYAFLLASLFAGVYIMFKIFKLLTGAGTSQNKIHTKSKKKQ